MGILILFEYSMVNDIKNSTEHVKRKSRKLMILLFFIPMVAKTFSELSKVFSVSFFLPNYRSQTYLNAF